MHSILVTFKSAAKPQDLAGPAAEISKAIRGVKGLISKAWLAEGDTLGGFYVFSDRAAAEAYYEGEIIAGIKENPAFSDFNVRHFGMMDEFSVANGTPSKTLAER